MKSNILSAAVVAAALLAGTVACTPDDVSTPGAVVTPAELAHGIAYTVTPDPKNPNVVYLKSLVSGVIPVWNSPNGISEEKEVTLSLPFAGDYPITFGVVTGNGIVWGEPYILTISTNNFEMLSDAIWTDLAGGVDAQGHGNPVTWVPMDKAYGNYVGSAPVGYMSPDDVKNDGSGSTDIRFGTGNWNMNWDPGFQSWLIPADDPYMGSEMTLYLDAVKGAVVEVSRVTSAGTSTYSGTFNLNISDPARPTLSFNNCEMLHAAWGDGVCANYFQDLKILECTPYVLQIATMRTNSEGPWWIVWNFVNKDLRDGIISLPAEGPELIDSYPVKEPEYENLEQDLFTIVGNATYLASEVTYNLNIDTPYDMMWWNPAVGQWEWLNAYGASWAPAISDEAIEEFALTLSKGSMKAELENGDNSGASAFTVSGNDIVFAEPMTFITAGNVKISGTKFKVLVCSPDDSELAIGVPVETDANGDSNKYMCVRLVTKAIGGGQTGPTVISVDNSKIEPFLEDGKYLRCQLYNPWGGDVEWPVDVTKLKLRKNQKLTIKYTLSGINWTAIPRVSICWNADDRYLWEAGGCFDNPLQTKMFNTGGENELSIVNETGATVTFERSSCLTLTHEFAGFTDSALEDAVFNITSLTIE